MVSRIPSLNVVVGVHPRIFLALVLSVTSISTSLGRRRFLSCSIGLSSVSVSLWISVRMSFILWVLLVPMFMISPSMFSVSRAFTIAFVVSST